MNISYIRSGNYFIPDLKRPEETQPIGKWGRMHWEYLKEHRPIQYTNLVLSCELWTYLADLNEQARERLDTIIEKLKDTEGVTEAMKAAGPIAWVQRMNNIRNCAEEIILRELIFEEGTV